MIGAGLVAAILLSVWLLRGDRREPLDPPEVLQERILSSGSGAEQAQAARDMVRHSEPARGAVHRALADYRGNDAGVLVPLAQSAMKTRDWRSIPRLFELMEHPDPKVRGKAGAAASVIMGADYGFHADAPPAERAEVLARMRYIHENLLPHLKRCYGDQ
jgi:hypothetical protein